MEEIKIDIWEYVRTDKGYILKNTITELINENGIYRGNFGKVSKHSKDIINIIEVGDLLQYKNNNTVNIIRVGNIEGLQDMFDNFEIISIETKERFENNCYSVEDI